MMRINKQDRSKLSKYIEFGLKVFAGLTDWEELNLGNNGFVTNPLLIDTDGVSDSLEIASGGNPTTHLDKFKAEKTSESAPAEQ